MNILTTCDDPFSLADLAARIRASSSFRFAWQFYESNGLDLDSTADIRRTLEAILATQHLHEFLRRSFDPLYHKVFTINPLHEHCRVVAEEDFENILARAANDHLGSYSNERRDATLAEKAEINSLFATPDSYHAFQLLPGDVPGCLGCTYSHIFSTWFYSVAWDWCLMAAWPSWGLFWMGCLTDTD